MSGPASSVAAGAGGPLETSLWDGLSEESLIDCLAPPTVVCREAGLESRLERRRDDGASRRALVLLLTARAAYRFPVARIYVAALAQRLALSEELCQRVRTALQEAIVNAVIHGNLGLRSGPISTMQEFSDWQQVVEARLASDPRAASPISIDARWSSAVLYVAVRDSGTGFRRDNAAAAPSRGSGRGLPIVGALSDHLSIAPGSSTLEMGFWL